MTRLSEERLQHIRKTFLGTIVDELFEDYDALRSDLTAANARAERLERAIREIHQAASAWPTPMLPWYLTSQIGAAMALVTAEAQPPAEPTTSEAAAPDLSAPLSDQQRLLPAGSGDAAIRKDAGDGAVASGAAEPSPPPAGGEGELCGFPSPTGPSCALPKGHYGTDDHWRPRR